MSLRNRPRTWLAAGAAALIVLPLLSYAASLVRPPTTTREIHIDASPDAVWAVLTDFPAYPDWNPVITSISGAPVVGQRLAFTTTVDEGSSMTFEPVVLVTTPGRELRWRGQLWLPRLADGEHSFVLAPDGDGTRLIQEESFTGVLAPLTPLLMDLGAAFDTSNQAIRDRAEAGVTH